jgi:hypothetical protein
VVKKYRLLVAGCVVALAGACVAQEAQPVSLGDLVKHSKKPTKKAVLVLSDEDMPPPSAQPAHDADDANGAAANAGAADSKSQSSSADTSKAEAKKSVKAVESKDQHTAELKQQLAKYQKEEDAWKTSIQYYQDLLANETSDFRRQMYQDSLNNDKKNAAVFQQKIDAVQSELSKTQPEPGPASDNPKGTGQESGSQP